VFRAGIAGRAENDGFAEAHGKELIEEGAALLGPGNSGEPVGFAVLDLRRQGLPQYEFGGVD